MKFAYKFSNLLGTVYRQGDLLFSLDGNSVISPVGNRITVFDLKNNKSITLPTESRFNYTALDLSPNGCILIAINEEGEAHMISLISQTIVHKYRFKKRVNAVKFSPDGKHFAVCKDNNVFIFKAPGPFSGDYNAFVMERVFKGAFDETTCIDWSFDSKLLAVGSKDTSVRIYPIEKIRNFNIYSLTSHTDSIVSCFFEALNLHLTTISRNGQTCVWECTIDSTDLKAFNEPPIKKQKKKKVDEDKDEEEDDIDPTKTLERTTEEMTKELEKVHIETEPVGKTVEKFSYRRIARHYLADDVKKDNKNAVLTSAAYHKGTKILVTGYSSGAFFIHEMPNVSLIHSLSISKQQISSVSINNTGDWIALGCGGLGQLLVWEWQSETYILKQQSHTANMTCVAYSADGQLLATGGEDGKVKLWNVTSGCCTVTWSEHSAAITAIAFTAAKRFLVSTGLDGTVRCYDFLRYRNFRTLTTPRPTQLASVAVDCSGEFVAAGGQDVFEIFLWSVKLGKLLEILSGHEGPVFSLAFSPLSTSTTLASVSWDKSLRIWEALDRGSAHETIDVGADGLCVAFRPDGAAVAVATLDGCITVFDVKHGAQLASVEGRNDLGSGRGDVDLVTAKQTLKAKSFTSLCYTANGEALIAGGQSKNVCIYDIKEAIIIKRFEITQNRSFDAVDDFINRRKLTEFGNIALVEEREDLEGGNVAIRLPGVRKGDMAARSMKPEVRVFSIQFSPTGQQWAAATSEGLLIYSLKVGLVFDPWDLQQGNTPAKIREKLAAKDYTNALTMAIKLNEALLINEVIENIPHKDVELIVTNLSPKCIERLLLIISNALENSKHLEYYLNWSTCLLTIHGSSISIQKNMPAIIALQKSLNTKYDQLSKICDFNKYTIQYVARLGDLSEKRPTLNEILQSESDEDMEE